jgi:hypothetical protein
LPLPGREGPSQPLGVQLASPVANRRCHDRGGSTQTESKGVGLGKRLPGSPRGRPRPTYPPGGIPSAFSAGVPAEARRRLARQPPAAEARRRHGNREPRASAARSACAERARVPVVDYNPQEAARCRAASPTLFDWSCNRGDLVDSLSGSPGANRLLRLWV